MSKDILHSQQFVSRIWLLFWKHRSHNLGSEQKSHEVEVWLLEFYMQFILKIVNKILQYA